MDDVLCQDEAGHEEARSAWRLASAATAGYEVRRWSSVSEGAPRARTRDLLSREVKEFVSTVWRGKREQDRDHVPSEEVWRSRRD